jgi:hypothetical protein
MWTFYLNYKMDSLTTMNPLLCNREIFFDLFPFLIVFEAKQNLPKYSCLGPLPESSFTIKWLTESNFTSFAITNHSEEAYWKGSAEALRNFIVGAKNYNI